MRKLLIILLLLPAITHGQAFVREFVLSNGWKIKKGDTVQIGNGSLTNGKFAHFVTTTRPKDNMGASYAGHKMIVIREFYSVFSRTVRLTLKDPSGERFGCYAEKAIRSKELVPPKNYWNYKKIAHAPELTYTDTIALNQSLSKEEIINRAVNWFQSALPAPYGAIRTQDRAKGTFIADASFPYKSKITLGNNVTNGEVDYIIKIFTQPAGFSYTITEFRHHPVGENDPLYHLNGKEYYGFGLLTIEPDCPRNKIYSYGKRWSNHVWYELKADADSAARANIAGLKNAIAR